MSITQMEFICGKNLHCRKESPVLSRDHVRYKFNIFYHDLIDKSKASTYAIEKDGSSSATCIVRFPAGPPYEDTAFRIVNKEL
ncbi:hypothetical protein MLD38_032656 [Melastoma candidum]|uniref:Uncharacterized protein n=1 Tax=Melastoma candidum TaxID=119954 RepID=A0ACB9M5I9_9MYRT|nr:hypothetical protein MLD38_032656 [Melastoma candidum]